MGNKRIWLYSRVAYLDMDDLEMQKTHLIDYAKEQGFSIMGVTAEQASGLDFSRTGLYEVLAAAEDGEMDFVLVKDLSRLGRDLVKTDFLVHWLKERDVRVICVDGTVVQTRAEILAELMKTSDISLSLKQNRSI